jgi:serine/threonine protein kinase
MTFTVTEVDAILSAALELPSAEERAEYVQRICGDNAELQKRVDELLAAHFAAGEFLEQPAATILCRNGEDIQAGPGTLIGPYKLLQQIGEGGMGIVFMAEQTEPIQRTVALKIIKPGMDTRQVIARFEAERQALAMMDHPSIAKVLDAGTTANGRPYFVMELVKGVPITKYCDDHKLTVRQRLELVKPVCEAVQHAHQKGIIHRDLKPTNVLVAEYDTHAIPKVIDFGVAKATAQKLTERTMFTEFGQVIGTVEYMSPEQAKFNQLDIDTRSDIYSLGVLLYELLTGTTPFERQRLREAAFDEVLRIIREEEPPKPSTRLTSSEFSPSIAANRHTEPARLSREVKGELDWIVMKCLDKDRNRRYETADALDRDIRNYLADEPVQACPSSPAYRFRKFARRNRAGLLAAGAVAGALVIGTVISTWQAVRATRAEKLATAAQNEAEANLQKMRAANDLRKGLTDKRQYANAFRFAILGDAEQLDAVIAAAITDRATSAIDGFDALVQGELRLVGGDIDGAVESIEQAIASGHRTAGTYKSLGWALLAQGQLDQSKDAFRQALIDIRRDDGSVDMVKADPDELTAAYFLDLVTEEQYLSKLESDKRFINFPTFYIGQRREIEGRADAAIAAYRRCAQIGNTENCQNSLAKWRLRKLENLPKR